jgi:hypothetical protein
MAHRKHLTQESHVAPEHTKKASHEQIIKKTDNKQAQREDAQKINKSNYGNSHIKDEHGEY